MQVNSIPHLKCCVAVIQGVFYKKVFECAHGQLSDLGPLVQGLGHFPQQQPYEEVVTAVILRQAELQTLLCGGPYKNIQCFCMRL